MARDARRRSPRPTFVCYARVMPTIAVVQTHPTFGNLSGNHAAILELIAQNPADVYVIPELYLSGYTFSTPEEVRSCALAPKNPYFDELAEVTSERGIAICGGYAELGESGAIYNSAFFIGDGTPLCNYRKTHLFYRETQFFTPGDTGFSVAEYHGTRYGVMVCFDWIFPEAARTLALAGAQVILHPANLVLPYCQQAMYARAVENRVFIATSNRVGRETNTLGDDLTFTGRSQLVTPTGEYLFQFDEAETGVRTAEIDPAEADRKQLNAFNTILADRRPEFYAG